jgi:hypothetical protein
MQRTGGPGIIPFELAGPGSSKRILERWGADGRRTARASLVLDFPFLVAYTSLNLTLTARARRAYRGDAAERVGRLVAVVQVAAGVCDAIENTALLGVLDRGGDDRLAAAARTAARAKFAGLAAGWLYGAGALAARG